MKERPILFSGEMVKAILEGRKTQTRRVIKRGSGEVPLDFHDGLAYFADGDAFEMPCPYGHPQDHLWVREAWQHFGGDYDDKTVLIKYCADLPCKPRSIPCPDWPQTCGDIRKRPSIHMPRWASRLTLEITTVRVERVTDISLADCQAEGIVLEGDALHDGTAMRMAYADLWDRINEKRGFGWYKNPWCWVVEFNRVKA